MADRAGGRDNGMQGKQVHGLEELGQRDASLHGAGTIDSEGWETSLLS